MDPTPPPNKPLPVDPGYVVDLDRFNYMVQIRAFQIAHDKGLKGYPLPQHSAEYHTLPTHEYYWYNKLRRSAKDFDELVLTMAELEIKKAFA